jgi:uncharacterized membrane protein
MKTVAAVFPTLAEAESVARHLMNLGIPSQAIHIAAGNDSSRHDEYIRKARSEETRTASAAAAGASIGASAGFVAGLVMLVIPGVGPIIAGGVILTLLTGVGIGAASGGLIGAFANMGISHDEAHLYEEAVRRGKVFVAVQVSEEMEPEAIRVMAEHGGRDINDEVEAWRASGWKHPYPNDSTITASQPADLIPPETYRHM